MPLGAATQGSVEWTFGTLSFLEAGTLPSPADYADAVEALADGLDLSRFILLGHLR